MSDRPSPTKSQDSPETKNRKAADSSIDCDRLELLDSSESDKSNTESKDETVSEKQESENKNSENKEAQTGEKSEQKSEQISEQKYTSDIADLSNKAEPSLSKVESAESVSETFGLAGSVGLADLEEWVRNRSSENRSDNGEYGLTAGPDAMISFLPDDTLSAYQKLMTISDKKNENESKTESKTEFETEFNSEIDVELDNNEHLDFSPLKSETNDSLPMSANMTPAIEIMEATAIQIRDESGQILADGAESRGAGSIYRDAATGDISSIKYPDGSMRNFTRVNNELIGIETIATINDESLSFSRLYKENGRWYADLHGVKALLPGEIELSKYGVLSFELENGNGYKLIDADGNESIQIASPGEIENKKTLEASVEIVQYRGYESGIYAKANLEQSEYHFENQSFDEFTPTPVFAREDKSSEETNDKRNIIDRIFDLDGEGTEENPERDRLPGLEEIEEAKERGTESGFSDKVRVQRERLIELMDSHLEEPQKARFKIILDRFEKRGKERIEAQMAAGQDQGKCEAEWDEKIEKSYENLIKMLDSDMPNATYDLRVRAKLVECAAFSLACPVKANDQGNWGCCWMISGVYAGVIQHPDKMTDMLMQLSNTGSYTDLEGKTWTPPKGLLSITNQGGSWTIENCGRGHRSPAAEIWTSVAAYLSEDGRRTDRGSRGGTPNACNHAMKKITGDTWTVTSEKKMMDRSMQKELLEKGAFICIYPGHMYLGALEKHGDNWVVCASLQHGDSGRRINGTVTDLQSWTITGPRRGYNPDIDIPECTDSPTGPIGNNWPGGGGDRIWPDGRLPFRPDLWPLIPGLSTYAFEIYTEYEKRRRRDSEKFEEEQRKLKEEERLREERQLKEKQDEERRQTEERRIEEQRDEERKLREREEEERKTEKEELELKQHKTRLENEEKFNKLKVLEKAQALESQNAFLRRSQMGGQNQQGRGGPLYTQIMDLQSPRVINGMRLRHYPVGNTLYNKVELLSPVDETSKNIDATLKPIPQVDKSD